MPRESRHARSDSPCGPVRQRAGSKLRGPAHGEDSSGARRPTSRAARRRCCERLSALAVLEGRQRRRAATRPHGSRRSLSCMRGSTWRRRAKLDPRRESSWSAELTRAALRGAVGAEHRLRRRERRLRPHDDGLALVRARAAVRRASPAASAGRSPSPARSRVSVCVRSFTSLGSSGTLAASSHLQLQLGVGRASPTVPSGPRA